MAAERMELDQLHHSWMMNDCSESSRKVMQAYYDGSPEDRQYLHSLLTPRISFGTAGLRAQMLPGFAHFNHVTVKQSILGLVDYLVETLGEHVRLKGIAIGHDHRAMLEPLSHPNVCMEDSKVVGQTELTSPKLASLARTTLMEKGYRVLWLGQCHTPLVPFAVKCYKLASGIMITASHNPKAYNGLKVYWENGCQINHPHDVGIASAIQRNLCSPIWPSIGNTPSPENLQSDTPRMELTQRYRVTLQQKAKSLGSAIPDPIVITPLHGIGHSVIQEVLSLYSPDRWVSWVKCQEQPDPSFHTVQFPNPEERGALDLATQQADFEGVRMILAVDPDADRFAAAEKLSDDSWHRFTGNEMGVLLAVHVLETSPEPDTSEAKNRRRTAMLTTTVSSAALGCIAEMEGFYCEETLTGFKWMSNRAQELENIGYNVIFAFEEALGYMFTDIVYDKDGVAALMEFLVARQTWKAELGLTPWQKLQRIYATYGYYADANTYLVSPSAATTNIVFANIRTAQRNAGAGTKAKPAVLTGRVCRSYRDLTTGVDTNQPDGKPRLPVDPSTHMITCEIDDARFTVRGSGTEPKVKLYVESRGSSVDDAQSKASALQKAIIDDWLHSLKQ